MRRSIVFVVAALVISLAVPALAMPNPPTNAPLVGDRIDILRSVPSVYPAKTAFHIWDGMLPDHVADLAEMRDVLNDPAYRIELEVDGRPVKFHPWFNVFDVDATCPAAWQERILERITFARFFLRLADRWGCDADGYWAKGYFRNYRRGLPPGDHTFRATFFWPDVQTITFDHTVTFTP